MFIVPIQPMQPMAFTPTGTVPKAPTRENSFRNVLSDAMTALNDTYSQSQADAYSLAFGDVDNLGEVMINTLKAESMVQATTQITARVISAYKEIMNLQI